jgi:DNA-binding phage protein
MAFRFGIDNVYVIMWVGWLGFMSTWTPVAATNTGRGLTASMLQPRPRETTMALTRDFRDTIRERAQREPAFRRSLLREGLQLINNGDFATGRAVLRNYINATIGFSELARETKIPSPSLQRMFGPSGNPSAQNLFGVIAALQRTEGVSIKLRMHAS